VPETSMYIDHFPKLWENQIWYSRQIPPVETITIPQRMTNRANNHFGLCILAANGGHIPTSLLGAMNVHC
jgi:hypothetical protein